MFTRNFGRSSDLGLVDPLRIDLFRRSVAQENQL